MVHTFLAEKNLGKSLSKLRQDEDIMKIMSSMDFIELLLILEERTGRKIDFTEVDPSVLSTLKDLMDMFTKTG